MLDLGIGATELMLIAAVALIVVGPKDLPVLMRRFGQFTGKMRAMAAEFRSSFDEMARQSELDDLRKEVEAMRNAKILELGDVNAQMDLEPTFKEIEASLGEHQTSFYPGVEYAEPASLPAADLEPAPAPKPRRPRKPKAAPTVEEASPARRSRKKAADV